MSHVAKFKNQLKREFHKYSPYFGVVFFVAGFIFDLFTLGRIDDLFNIFGQLAYLIVLLLLILKDFIPEGLRPKFLSILEDWHSEIIQFCLGALLSAYTIFYFKSSSFSTSVIFLFMMIALLIINELKLIKMVDRYLRIVLFHLCLITFLFIIIPIFSGTLSSGDFALGIAANFLIYLLIIKGLKKFNADDQKVKQTFIYPGLAVISLFILCYLTNLLPPLPLALKHISIHHNIERENGNYKATTLSPRWMFWKNGDTPFLANNGDRPYVFISVFAPRNFDGKIFIHWQKYIEGNWKSSDRIPLIIKGGRENGFRGFSFKNNWTEGEWRVLIESEDQREIGRVNFDMINSNYNTSDLRTEFL